METPYPGIDEDDMGGMTDRGRILRDAWAFGLMPETETGAGWTRKRFEDLWARVEQEWQRYDFRVANLPDEVRARFERIQAEALAAARAAGWDPDGDLADEAD
ncbi:hypothetical protein [Rhodospira trueperi]|uniref:Uncharacterized protein n=1 Tax=Rhodospira trueperi TaxID=69960 RepID=A0A1G7GDM3_9PROT|nr:hypothetical protein [Rhodospira trueperi]SDE86185.1 hypothetical protein SAMN05421720_11449 [Rhodospira trueperi]